MDSNKDEQLSRRQFLKFAAGAVAPGALGTGPAAAAPAAARDQAAPAAPAEAPATPPQGYNILFILTDQERHFDGWPFPVPGREELARRSVSFTNHQIASCVCSPSRATIYTGQHMQHTGVFDNAGLPWQPDMSTDIRTVGHMLRDAGYHTAYLGK